MDHKRNILKQIREIRSKVRPDLLARAERAVATANVSQTDMPYPGHAAVALFLQNHDPTGAIKAAVRQRAREEDAAQSPAIDSSLSEDHRPARAAEIKEDVSAARQTAAAPAPDSKRGDHPRTDAKRTDATRTDAKRTGAKRDDGGGSRVVRVRTLDMLIPGLRGKK